jgi:DNA-binding transcriptional MerR regulator
MDINELVQKSGLTRRTIYFYIQQGILPAAQGAGLGAWYTEEHLQRLQALPVLRQRGMRLDEIRSHFRHTSLEDLRQLARESEKIDIPGKNHTVPAQSMIRYILYPGVELLVDGRLDAQTRKNVLLLLEQAKLLFQRRI